MTQQYSKNYECAQKVAKNSTIGRCKLLFVNKRVR